MGDFGCHFDIILELKLEEGSKRQIEFHYLSKFKQWELPCHMGFHLFEEYYPNDFGKMILTVHDTSWFPADTNQLTALFATVKALAEYLKMDIPNLQIDKEKQAFIFPERRSFHTKR